MPWKANLEIEFKTRKKPVLEDCLGKLNFKANLESELRKPNWKANLESQFGKQSWTVLKRCFGKQMWKSIVGS